MMSQRRYLCVIAPAVAATLAHAGPIPGLTGVGVLPGATNSSVYGLSGDGCVAGGMSETSNPETAVLWSDSAGMTVVPWTGSDHARVVYGLNGDGSVAVGYTSAGAYRWTSSSGFQDISAGGLTRAHATSADGSVVVGEMNETGGTGSRGFRWTPTGGALELDSLGGAQHSWANGVSNDGAVTVGSSAYFSGFHRAVRWTGSSTPQELPRPAGVFGAAAYGTNGDGSVIVGAMFTPGERAFRFTDAGGMVDLGFMPGGSYASALDVNADGTAVVGYGDSSSGNPRAFYWNSALGMVDLTDYAASLGIDTSDWSLWRAESISDDGMTIAGRGIHEFATGQTRGEGWVITLPSPGMGCVVACMGFVGMKRRR